MRIARDLRRLFQADEQPVLVRVGLKEGLNLRERQQRLRLGGAAGRAAIMGRGSGHTTLIDPYPFNYD
jgi:hypothetical protein